MHQQDFSASSAPSEVGIDALLCLVKELIRGQLETDRRLVAGRRRPDGAALPAGEPACPGRH
eukprot:2495632-Lingulodinium_polyedra.AAC.1